MHCGAMLKACCHSLCKYSWLYSYYPSFFFYFVGLNIDSWMFDIVLPLLFFLCSLVSVSKFVSLSVDLIFHFEA